MRRLDVIPRGFGGYTSANLVHLIDRVFWPTLAGSKGKIALYILWIGANDACLSNAEQHIPLEIYAENYRRLLTDPSIKRHNPDIKILALNAPPICEYKNQQRDVSKGRSEIMRTAENTRQYAAKAIEVAEEVGIPYVDVWSGIMNHLGWKNGEPLIGSHDLPENAKMGEIFPDGLHLSGQGYKIVYEMVIQKIEQTYPELSASNMKMAVPWWGDIDRSDMAKSLAIPQ